MEARKVLNLVAGDRYPLAVRGRKSLWPCGVKVSTRVFQSFSRGSSPRRVTTFGVTWKHTLIARSEYYGLAARPADHRSMGVPGFEARSGNISS